MTRALAAVTTAALALTLAACGSEDKKDYEERVGNVGNDLQRTFGQIGRGLGGSASLDDVADSLGRGERALDDAADELAGVEAPDDIESEHKELTDGVRELSDDLGSAVKAAEAGNVMELQELGEGIDALDSGKKIRRSTQAIQDKGYDINGSSGS
jgi:hypothetical protein